MHMHSRLATSRTDVDPNVVAVGCKRNLYVALSLAKELKDSDLLVLRHVEEVGYVTPGHDQHVTAKGIADRCRLTAGDFFESVPVGGDVYMMKYVLHNWEDESCVKILSNCRKAMSAKGRVLIADPVIAADNRPEWGKLLDIQMMVLLRGRERTKKEFAAVFRKAGLKLTRVIPTTCPLSLVEAVRA